MKTHWVSALMLLLLVIATVGCQNTTNGDAHEVLRKRLSVEEQMFAKIVLAHFDVTHAGEVVLVIKQEPASLRLLDYLNGGKLRFITCRQPYDFSKGPVFCLRFVDYFYPGYAYVQVENTGPFRQWAYGYVFQKAVDWELVDSYKFEDWTQELDRAAYIKTKIAANQPTMGTVHLRR